MENKKTKYFETSPGNKSAIRLQSFITMWFAFLIIGYETIKDNEVNFEIALLLLVAAFAPKLIQKFAEKKSDKSKI